MGTRSERTIAIVVCAVFLIAFLGVLPVMHVIDERQRSDAEACFQLADSIPSDSARRAALEACPLYDAEAGVPYWAVQLIAPVAAAGVAYLAIRGRRPPE